MLMKICASTFFFASLIASVSAQTASPLYYEYSGQIDRIKKAAWNPTLDLNKGWVVSFWGDADPAAGCSGTNGLINGPVDHHINWDLLADTGISLGNSWEHYTPTSNTDLCANKGWLGFSHAHFKRNSDQYSPAGVGIYTHSGPKPTDSGLAFFQPYGPEGDHERNPKSANGVGTFVSHACLKLNNSGCPDNEEFRPFGAGGLNYDKLRVALISEQTLVKFTMENPATQQIRQEFGVNFIVPDTGFQIQYLFISAIDGVHADISPNTSALADFDLSQGNIAYIVGSIGGPGASTKIEGVPLWTSWASPTQQATWAGSKTFQVEISFNQLLNGLKVIAAKKMNKKVSDITTNDLNTVFSENFGEYYSKPESWTIYADYVGHEITNPSWAANRAFVGGGLTRFVKTSINF